MKEVFVVGAKRTPIGKFCGAFAETPAADLGAAAVRGCFEQSGLKPEAVDELIFGHGRQAGNGPNTARQVLKKSGIPYEKPAFTVNKACASSLKTITLGWQAIVLGDAEIVVAGGMENMTRTPFILDQMRMGYRLGTAQLHDGMYKDGFLCPLCGLLMGETAENLAAKYNISRDEADKFSFISQSKCKAALESGKFGDEIAPVEITVKGKTNRVTSDEHPRPSTMEELTKLKPVFKKDGVVTPGNACGICDGAAAVILASEDAVKKNGLKPLARVTGYSQAGCDPAYMGVGPVYAMQKYKQKYGKDLNDFDLIEINEAFAVQVIACHREMKFDLERTNVNGGAIALGHPIGATGSRIVVTMLYEMKRRNAKRGIATLCVSGGLGMAISFESA